jgi:hypothetical protein
MIQLGNKISIKMPSTMDTMFDESKNILLRTTNHAAMNITTAGGADDGAYGGKQNQQLQQHYHSSSSSIIKQYDIRPYDILCGRDKAAFNHVGNRRFRVSISINIPRYDAAKTKAQKTKVIKFVCAVFRKEVGVRFLKKQPGRGEGEYIELSQKEARKKIGHALRDMSVAKQELNEKRNKLSLPLFADGTPIISMPITKRPMREYDEQDWDNSNNEAPTFISFDDNDFINEYDEKEEESNHRQVLSTTESNNNSGDNSLLYAALSRYVDKSLSISHEDTDLLLEPLPMHEPKEQQQEHSMGNMKEMPTPMMVQHHEDDPCRCQLQEKGFSMYGCEYESEQLSLSTLQQQRLELSSPLQQSTTLVSYYTCS